MADELKQIKQKVERTNKHSAFTFLVFLVISTAAWFLVKLSENYTTQAVFRLQLTDAPADQWVLSDEQPVAMSLNVDGFHVLRYKMMREPNRVISVALDKVPYRQESGNTYSFSSQYVAKMVSDRLNINASDVTMNDSKIFFSMNPLKSKVVPVQLRDDIKTQRQFDIYGIPMLEPASVTIYGPEEIIDTVRSVQTMLLSKSNVSESFSEIVELDLLDGKIRSNTTEVKTTIEVEKYTEIDIEVPVRVADSLKMRFFPETVSVKCFVAMKDYASVKPEDFKVAVDMKQLEALQPLLDVRLVSWPDYVQIPNARPHPDKVEYLIVQ